MAFFADFWCWGCEELLIVLFDVFSPWICKQHEHAERMNTVNTSNTVNTVNTSNTKRRCQTSRPTTPNHIRNIAMWQQFATKVVNLIDVNKCDQYVVLVSWLVVEFVKRLSRHTSTHRVNDYIGQLECWYNFHSHHVSMNSSAIRQSRPTSFWWHWFDTPEPSWYLKQLNLSP